MSDASKDVVKVVTGLIATLSALVLGLLIASAKTAYENANEGFRQSSARIILLDQPHAGAVQDRKQKDLREVLRNSFAARIDQLFPKDPSRRSPFGRHRGNSCVRGVCAENPRTIAADRRSGRGTSAVARRGNHRFGSSDAMDGDRSGGKPAPDAVPGRPRPLAYGHVRELRSVRPPQRDCSHRSVPRRAFALGSDLSDRRIQRSFLEDLSRSPGCRWTGRSAILGK